MLTALLVFVSLMLTFVAGEAVRVQCRRMLVRPVSMHLGAREAMGIALGSEARA